jgi:mannose-6-phosphate isomerase-like protein (cupin superfamily)|tara:strand:- start:24 stop:503 length:480 start_codon:yes stop_codon:yes gene_type:complete
MSRFYDNIKSEVKDLGFSIINEDFNRPWGGFFQIDQRQSQKFVHTLISKEINVNHLKISPKILIVEPNQRLSWQYHNRRKEIWKVYRNNIGVIRSLTNFENDLILKKEGEIIHFEAQERHRLVGLDKIGVVAEIWIHTDLNNLSDENDIVRINDDYKRT